MLLSRITMAAILWVLALGCSPKRPPVLSYEIGERAPAGQITYNVLEARWVQRLGQDPNTRIPQAHFLLLRLSVTNGGSTEVSVPLMALVGQDGRTYAELTDGEGVTNWLGMLRKLKPAETIFGWIAFDTPRGDYQLRVSDDAFDPEEARVAEIQIPLRLAADSDYLPAPKPYR